MFVPIVTYRFSAFIVRFRQIVPKRSVPLRGTLLVGPRTFGGFLGLPASQSVSSPRRDQSPTRESGRSAKPGRLVRERRNRSAG